MFFCLKRAEHLERVEPAAICRQKKKMGERDIAAGSTQEVLPAQGYLEASLKYRSRWGRHIKRAHVAFAVSVLG